MLNIPGPARSDFMKQSAKWDKLKPKRWMVLNVVYQYYFQILK